MSERPDDSLEQVISGSATPTSALNAQSSSNSQDNGDTQRRLQQASLALELALNRIVEVRQSLLNLSQSLPRMPDFTAYEGMDLDPNAGRMAPPHEALVLTGNEFASDMNHSSITQQTNRYSLPPPPVPPLNRPLASFGASIHPIERPVPTEEAPARFTFRSTTMSPVPDGAATTRGLRVAAREANPHAAAQFDHFMTIPMPYGDIIDTALGLFPRPSAPPARPDHTLHPVPGLDGVLHGEYRSNDRRPPTNSTPLSWRSPDPRRWRLRPNLSPFLPFIAPPNPETQSLPTFADLTGAPPSLDELPSPNLASMNSLPVQGDTPLPFGFVPERDSVVDRYRRYQDARHDSMGSDLNIDWSDDDFLSWLFPQTRGNRQRAPRRPEREREPLFSDDIREGLRRSVDEQFRLQENLVRVTRTTETQVSPADQPASAVAGRRRGWARLDADGNEIPQDEEQELERSRTEYRLRMLQQQRARRHNQTAGPLLAPLRDGDTTPVGYAFPSIGTLYDEQSRSGQQRVHYGSVLDSMLAVPQTERWHTLSSSAYESGEFYVDPLPMPLASMVTDNQKQNIEAAKDIIVPTYACLAGR